MKLLQGNNHQIYLDNYFSYVSLAEYLLFYKVFCCDTFRQTRKYLPKDLISDKKSGKGGFYHCISKGGLAIYKRKENKSVYMLSNIHGTETVTVLQSQKDGSGVHVSCTNAVKDYNSFRGGIDKADMYCAICGIPRNSKKWMHRIFFGVLDRAAKKL